jgi:UDP-glucose 4-epimerase
VLNASIPYKVKNNIQIVSRRQGDVAELVAKCDKANRILGWQAKRNLEQMCKDSLNFTIKNSKTNDMII